MPITVNGIELSGSNNITFGGSQATTATLNGGVVWQRAAAARVFTLADAGISFSVAQNGTVSLSIGTGTLVGTNYTNGQNIGTVSSVARRRLTGSVRVPNNPAIWTNANQLITITGITTEQAATSTAVAFTLADAGVSFSVAQSGSVSLSISTGTLFGTNYTNGQNIGTVTTATTRTLTGSVRVPNNPAIWSNANQLITITGITAQQAAAARPFTLADAGVSFSVAQNGIVSLSIGTGTFAGTNYTNGQNIGTVSTATTRTLTGSVRVPNDSTLWSNAGQTITITGITARQAATIVAVAFTLANAGITFSVAQNGRVSLSIGTGILVGTNYANGQNIGTVSSVTTRTLTGSVRVPNNPILWTNANQLITILGITAQQIATPVDGIASWGDWMNFGSSTGGVSTFTYGMFGAYSPAASAQTYGTSFTQTRSRSVTENISAVMQPQRRECEEDTAPSGGGAPGICPIGETAMAPSDREIGDFDSQIVTTPASSMTVSATVANGGLEEQTATGTNWDSTLALVRVGTLAVDVDTGAVSGTPQVSTGRYVRHTWVGTPYSGIPMGGTAIDRTVQVVIQAPTDAADPTETATVNLTVAQSASGLNEITAADLMVATIGTVPAAAQTATQLRTRLRFDTTLGGTLTVTHTQPANISTTTRTFNIRWSWTGAIPTGFLNAGAMTTITGSTQATQAAAASVDATSVTTSVSFITFGPGSPGRDQVTITPSPSNGTWNISGERNGVTLTRSSGTGTQTVGVNYNGAAAIGIVTLTVRSGLVAGSGTQLATIQVEIG